MPRTANEIAVLIQLKRLQHNETHAKWEMNERLKLTRDADLCKEKLVQLEREIELLKWALGEDIDPTG